MKRKKLGKEICEPIDSEANLVCQIFRHEHAPAFERA